MHNDSIFAAGSPRLKSSGINTRKKMIIYITAACVYLIAVLIAGLVMNPDLYGVHY